VSAPLLLILVVALAFLATHVAYEWLARRLLIVSGAEYLVLGVLLGPQVSGLFSTAAAAQFRPIVILGIGWLGLSVGMQFRLQRLIRIPAVAYRLSLVQSLVTLTLVAAGATYATGYAYQLPMAQALVPGIALGAIAVASTPAGLDVAFGRSAAVRAPVLQQIEVALGMDALVSVVAFGLLLTWAHGATPVAVRALTTTEWAAVTLGIGVVGGTLFHLFLGEEQDPDRLFVSLAGAVIVTSGAAAYLDLSPTLAALVMGVLLANTMRSPKPVQQVLAASERPLYYALLLLAGASWQPESAIGWWLVIAHYVVLRTLAKLWGSGIATWWNRAQPLVGLDWGRALIGQGRLAIALALDYSRRADLPNGDLVFTCAAVSVLFTEFLAARFVRSAVGPLLLPLEKLSETAGTVVDTVREATETVTQTVAQTVTQRLPGRWLRDDRADADASSDLPERQRPESD
jgi:Kef-type K+ transport system membrane component KefB